MVAGALPSGTEISKGIREQEPKTVLDVEQTSGISLSTSLSGLMAKGVRSGSCKSNSIARKCGGRRAHTRRNEARRSGTKRPSRAGEGEAVDVATAAARGESETAKPCGTVVGVEERTGVRPSL